MDIGKRLKELRVSKGLSLNQVQGEVNISSLHKLEQGKYKSFKCEHLVILSNYYKVSPLYLLGLEEDTNNIEPKWIVLIQKLKEHGLTPRDVIIALEKSLNVSLRN